ncbi:hypothetical protein [Craterilacuibacter sinensis]|uniref:Uncharacterized protein n=1 Tax=Craterilacuibacter sinensis TaxID=2686017 RepID=A0A845BLQ5_9NEIS|nr:hypothetical protein [Craterilacuibacter sinensis]MXR37242.1 hypothetical protein [Craterilacuibacter sinensis]
MIAWDKESGRAEADADYVMTLPIVGWRKRELRRLGEIYGVAYRKRVEEMVSTQWTRRDRSNELPLLELDGNPRDTALSLIREK